MEHGGKKSETGRQDEIKPDTGTKDQIGTRQYLHEPDGNSTEEHDEKDDENDQPGSVGRNRGNSTS